MYRLSVLVCELGRDESLSCVLLVYEMCQLFRMLSDFFFLIIIFQVNSGGENLQESVLLPLPQSIFRFCGTDVWNLDQQVDSQSQQQHMCVCVC